MKNKLSILFLCVLGALVVLLGVITYINFHSGEKYKKQVLSQAQQKYQNRTIPSKRGSIYDRNGNLLATSNKVYNVILDCRTINSETDYIEPTIRALENIFGVEETAVRKALTDDETKDSQYWLIKRAASMDDQKAFEDYCDLSDTIGLTAAEIKERQNVKGVWFEEDYQRVYLIMSLPAIHLASPIPGTRQIMAWKAITTAALWESTAASTATSTMIPMWSRLLLRQRMETIWKPAWILAFSKLWKNG